MRNNIPSVATTIEDDVIVDPEDPRRSDSKRWMNVLLVFSFVCFLIVGTLLILDFLIPACMSTIRPCQTISGMKWMASKEKLTLEESKAFCELNGYQVANIIISKEIFAENKRFLDKFGDFWIIGKKN